MSSIGPFVKSTRRDIHFDFWVPPIPTEELHHCCSSLRTAAWTISTFSCDIAYSESPTASRAFQARETAKQRTPRPSRKGEDVPGAATRLHPRSPCRDTGCAPRTGRCHRRRVRGQRQGERLPTHRSCPRCISSSPAWPRSRPPIAKAECQSTSESVRSISLDRSRRPRPRLSLREPTECSPATSPAQYPAGRRLEPAE